MGCQVSWGDVLVRGPAERKQADHGGGGEALYSESFGRAPAKRSPSWGPRGWGVGAALPGAYKYISSGHWSRPSDSQAYGVLGAIKTSSTAEGAGKDWWGTAKPPEEQRPALLPRLLSTRGPGAQPAEGASSQRHQALTREASRVEVLLAPASEKAALPRHSGPAGGVLQTEPSCPWPGRARRADGSPPQGGRGKGGVSEAPVRPQPPDGASCRSEHGPVQEGRGA